ncbi:MAG: hypothetical protein ACYS0E_07880 [Planctomycetota bacterium]|jgi:hypothetical protein
MTVPDRSIHIGACLLLGLLLNACVSLKFGTPIPTKALDGLVPGESTHADVLMALGQPRGEGGMVVSQQPLPREILLYEYMTGDQSKMNLEMLIVVIESNRYDGHLWFAATERIKKKSGGKVVEGGTFPDTKPLDAKFRRGKTTRAVVVEALGQPNGTGASMMPPDHTPSEVLYYENIRLELGEKKGDEYELHVDQRILLVMIRDGFFDGYMWFLNAEAAETRSR